MLLADRADPPAEGALLAGLKEADAHAGGVGILRRGRRLDGTACRTSRSVPATRWSAIGINASSASPTGRRRRLLAYIDGLREPEENRIALERYTQRVALQWAQEDAG
jgi:hypothetical protein